LKDIKDRKPLFVEVSCNYYSFIWLFFYKKNWYCNNNMFIFRRTWKYQICKL